MTSRSPPPLLALRTVLFARVRLFFARQTAALKARVRAWRTRIWARTGGRTANETRD